MRSRSGETALSRRLLIAGYEPSIDELLNDTVAEVIMRYDRITREDVRRSFGQIMARRAVLQNGHLPVAASSMAGSGTDQYAGFKLYHPEGSGTECADTYV